MPGDDEEFDLQLEGPRMRPRRTLVVDGDSDSVIEHIGEDVDADAPLAAPPKAPGRAPTSGGSSGRTIGDELERQGIDRARVQELARRQSRDEAHSPAWDALQSIPQATGGLPTAAVARTGDRLSELFGDVERDPAGSAGAAAAGTLEGVTLGSADEALGAGVALFGDEDPVEAQRAVRGAFRGARAANPYAMDIGRDAGGAAVSGGATAPATAAGRIGVAALGGAAAGAAYSDGETIEDVLPGAAVGGATGAAFGVGGEALGRVARRPDMQHLQEAADDALLSATTSTGRGQTAIAAFDRGATDRRASRRAMAQALRETNAVPAIGTTRDVERGARRAREGAEQEMRFVSDSMEGGGPSRREVAARLRERVESEADNPGARPFRSVLEQWIDDLDPPQRPQGGSGRARPTTYRDGAAPSQVSADRPIDYDALMRMTGRLRQAGAGQARGGQVVPMGREAQGEVSDILRGAYDDVVERELGAGARQRYRDARRQWRASEIAEENAITGSGAHAGNSGLGAAMHQMLPAVTGGSIGTGVGAAHGSPGIGGAVGAVGAMLAARGWNAVQPRVRARYAQALVEMAQRRPEALARAVGGPTARRILAAIGQATTSAEAEPVPQRDEDEDEEFDLQMEH